MCYEYEWEYLQQRAEEARRSANNDLEIAKAEAELSSMAAQLAAIRKIRGK